MSTTSTSQPIVVGVDGSPSTAQVLAWATREAALRDAPLLLVHAAGNALSTHAQPAGVDLASSISGAVTAGRRIVTEAADYVRGVDPRVRVDTHVSLDASDSALERSHPHPALIVIGVRSHARRHATADGLESHLGRGLECPVVEVGDAAESHEMLVLADGTAWSVPVLRAAFEEAAARDLSITVAFVLADPYPDSPTRDLHLMDETARIEAASGPSQLGLQRTLLGVQVQVLHDRFPAVRHQLVDLDDEVDALLAAAPGLTGYVVADSAHLNRLHELAGSTDGRRWITVLVANDRPATEPQVLDVEPEVRHRPERELDLEAWWDAPTVDEPRVPVRVRVRRQLRRHLEP